ncbi:sialidase family protein [Spirosoma sordidisoli]|uniref:Exo-alpha-sialidase n=1 Tax=Spirosoma sordidisoli TaxID=2502893 RepID=A0A4Q2UQP8_9BACT|nr:sialidase family protein [Spirosoma sordidisoli]RYC71766.1 exo-alpha-sialidase [Spirosoma sordidisoli]
MKHIVFVLALLAATPALPVQETVVSDPRATAATPRLTTDRHGNPLLSWVEKETDNKAAFFFAISTDDGQTFGPKIRVPVPPSVAVHAEGMPKLAQKADGTLLALFEVPRPVGESRFAGDLLYVMSTDQGRTWTQPNAIHDNTAPGKSHSFADLTRLPNGEIGMVWLDDKLPGREGRSVKFRQTLPGGGFSREQIVDENACQCCRTNIFVDRQQRIHLTYRDLLPAKAGETGIRDISQVVSTDGGRRFGPPKRVLADNWRVNACPHAGPSVTEVGSALLVSWFSGKEDAVGLRLAQPGAAAPVAVVLSNRARHPQVTALHDQLVWVWDESVRQPDQPDDEPMPVYDQRIAMRVGANAATTFITPASVLATYPVVLPLKKGLLLAYERKEEGANVTIAFQRLTGETGLVMKPAEQN